MRRIQYVSQYIALSEDGLVPRLECPMDQGLLQSNLDLEDNIYLYCLSCSYKKFIGEKLYNSIKERVDKSV